jgi:hypothetical protein
MQFHYFVDTTDLRLRGGQGTEHPLKSSGFACLLAHLFQPCTVLQETMQPCFQFSLVLQLSEERSAFLHCQCSGHMSALRYWNLRPPCRKCNTNHWNNTRHREMEFIFYIYCRHNVKKGKTLNPAAEHHSSPQSCIVRPETSAGQSLVGGI